MDFTWTIRPANPDDVRFLTEMLAIAADWRPGEIPRPPEAVMAEPQLAHYIQDWPKDGDYGVIAEATDPVGGAWWRFFSRNDPGYGFVDESIPELTVGVVHAVRGKGIGRAILVEMIAEAARRQLRGLCLSVEGDNYAARLYERLGFRRLKETGGAATMLLDIEAERRIDD